jgi:hypothetical protein
MAPEISLESLGLVKFASKRLDPNEDRLIEWLTELGFWNSEVENRVKKADNHLPLDIEYDLKDGLKLPLDNPTRAVFSDLLRSDVGLSLKALGFHDGEWADPECCVGRLLNLKVARVQDSERFKALCIAFDPRAQFLIGARKIPYN